MNSPSRKTEQMDRRQTLLFAALFIGAAALILRFALSTPGAGEVIGAVAVKMPAVTLENTPGNPVPRVILSARAVQRLGIETASLGEEAVPRTQMVSGLIIPPMDKVPESRPSGGVFGGFGRGAQVPAVPAEPVVKGGSGGIGSVIPMAAGTPSPASGPRAEPGVPLAGEAWVLVNLSPGEWERLAKDRPARLLPLSTRDSDGKPIWAVPAGFPPQEDIKRSMLAVYYKVPGTEHGLAINKRMRVELQLDGSVEKQKVVPYSAVYYDAKGAAWVYVNGDGLSYERQPITVERVVGELALLNDGPPVGTSVVTVGAALLYGAEIFKK